jgi:cyclic pyranopterin phosphate synthase
MDKQLSHTNDEGKARMVDVGHKSNQLRIARATGKIRLAPETIQLISDNLMKKGDVITVAEIAGVNAAKQTSNLIPLCHQIQLTKIKVVGSIVNGDVIMESEIGCIGKTGVEMEALSAVTVALLTVYDMCKAVDKSMVISDIKLIEKIKHEPGE